MIYLVTNSYVSIEHCPTFSSRPRAECRKRSVSNVAVVQKSVQNAWLGRCTNELEMELHHREEIHHGPQRVVAHRLPHHPPGGQLDDFHPRRRPLAELVFAHASQTGTCAARRPDHLGGAFYWP